MHKYMLKWLLLAASLLIIFTPISGQATTPVTLEGASSLEPTLRVGILSNQQTVHISADSSFDLVAAGTNTLLGSFRSYEAVTISVNDSGFTVNDLPVAATGINIVQKKDDVMVYIEQYIHVNKRRYRGDIGIHRTMGKAGMTVVNTLPIEQYLYGIIKNEISPEWPMEAVKAQAVAARTYALANYNKHKADGFDVCATTDCQVYGGRESEAPRSLEAVNDTRGLVLLHNGKLITAYFHSSSGGYTENSENVWQTSQPYLRGVTDYDQNCPYFKWEKKLTLAELNQAVIKAGYNIGVLKAIELSPLAAPPIISGDRGVSGRVKTIRLLGTSGNIEISGTKFRSMLDLKSTLFDISVISNEFAKPVLASTEKKLSQPQISFALPTLDNPNTHLVTGEPADLLVINGSGWGHGLGLSQWGAKAMAEKAPTGSTEYFKEILKHYYQGIEIKKAY